MKQYGLKIFLPIAIITAIFSLAITQSSYYRKISKSQQLINRVYNQIFSSYVHQIDPEAFTKDAINGITEKLDPFTEFMVDDEQHNINVPVSYTHLTLPTKA